MGRMGGAGDVRWAGEEGWLLISLVYTDEDEDGIGAGQRKRR